MPAEKNRLIAEGNLLGEELTRLMEWRARKVDGGGEPELIRGGIQVFVGSTICCASPEQRANGRPCVSTTATPTTTSTWRRIISSSNKQSPLRQLISVPQCDESV